MCKTLNDTPLLAKLEPGDMIALEAKYHQKCLVNLYNKARALDRAAQDKDCEAQLHGNALAELVAHMEDLWKEDIATVFKLTDLTQMYKNQLEHLGAVVEGQIHFKADFCLHFQTFFCLLTNKGTVLFSVLMKISVLHLQKLVIMMMM